VQVRHRAGSEFPGSRHVGRICLIFGHLLPKITKPSRKKIGVRALFGPNSGSEHISGFAEAQRICDCQAQIAAAAPGKRSNCLIAEQLPKKVL
jgi:hypothetical protein